MKEEVRQEKIITQEFVKAQPEVLPEPTYMPFLLAVSLLFVGWGLLSTWILTVAGLIGMGVSIYGWIKALVHERTNQS